MTRIAGDLGELRDRPGFDWSLVDMGTWLRECALREADGALSRARGLEADGAGHQRVMAAYAAAENLAADHPDAQAGYAAHTDAYAARHGLRGWYRYSPELGVHRGLVLVQVNRLRTPADGDTGRYRTHIPYDGGTFPDGSRVWVVDRDTGATVARFGHGESDRAGPYPGRELDLHDRERWVLMSRAAAVVLAAVLVTACAAPGDAEPSPSPLPTPAVASRCAERGPLGGEAGR